MPTWYMGDPFRSFYPPLTTLVLTPLALVFPDIWIAYRLFASLILVAFALGTYLFVADQWNRWAGALAAVLAVWAPYQLRTLFFEGNLPRVLALLALPLLALFTERLLVARGRRVPWMIALTLSWSWAILAHPQQAAMFAIAFTIYLIARLFLDPKLPLKRAGLWLASLTAAGFVVAPWALPAYGRVELTNVPYLPVEKVTLFAAEIGGLLPSLDLNRGVIPFGLGMILLSLLAAAARPDPRRTAWLLAALASIWLSLGPKGVAFSLLPLNEQLLPERFLNFAAFALAVAASGLLPIRNRGRLARSLVLGGLVLIDILPGFSLLRQREFPAAQAAMGEAVARVSAPSARTALLTYPEPTSIEVYYAGAASDIINGWALENTPHHPDLRRFPSAPEWGPEYFGRLLALWNVDTVVVGGDPTASMNAETALESVGFNRVEEVAGYRIWASPGDTSPIRRVPESQVLAVGDRITPVLGAFPFAEKAESQTIGSFSLEELQSYSAVFLYRFAESGASSLTDTEGLLIDYLEGGGNVLTDLSGMEDAFGRTLSFVGVNVLRLSLDAAIEVQWSPPLEGLPQSLPLQQVAPEGWAGATYDGLDAVFASVSYGGEPFPILGYRDVGEGRIWFVGMNLLFYAQQSGNGELAAVLQDFLLGDLGLETEASIEPLRVTSWRVSGNEIIAQVTSPQPVERALVSFTYHPRWRALVDGTPAPLQSYEGLMLTSLPSGTHDLTIRYLPFGTPWPWVGLGILLLGVVGYGAAFEYERRTFIPLPELPDVEGPETTKEYAPCANCGFLAAEIGPPTSVTYPFQVVSCPICGLRMDDDGFQPGEPLTEEGRHESLDEWLREHGYDPQLVHSRWGFTHEDFFGGGEGDDALPFPLGEETAEGGE